MISLLFVDDHPIVTAGLISRFRAVPGIQVAGAVTRLADALTFSKTTPVDIALVDVQLEVLATPAEVATLSKQCRVVLFSARKPDDYVRSLLAAGAACFLEKAVPLEELDRVLARVHAGEVASLPAGDSTGVRAKLSSREYEVYVALAGGQAPKEVASQLGIAASTVYCHIENVRKKLGLRSVRELVTNAHGSDS